MVVLGDGVGDDGIEGLYFVLEGALGHDRISVIIHYLEIDRIMFYTVCRVTNDHIRRGRLRATPLMWES